VKKWRRKYILASFVIVILAVSVSADANYSTENDPLVTLSYVEKLKGQIIEELKNQTISFQGDFSYEVLELRSGQSLMAKSSCELILRSGSANVVVTDEVNKANSIGLSDLTAGTELTDSKQIPVNHYIIISRADGRGVKITSDIAYLLIRGEYEIVTK